MPCRPTTMFFCGLILVFARSAVATDDEGLPKDSVFKQLHTFNEPGFPIPAAEFSPGSVEELTENIEITRTDDGFVLQMPNRSPIPTPAIARGRLYTGGGFSSTELYCFDAMSGESIWKCMVSDDGPSAPAISDDTVVYNTESCTLFALNAEDGQMRWSWYLGDPLMSTPTISGGRVFTVYPAVFPQDQLTQKPKQAVPTYVCICIDLKTGRILWQKWVDGDCITTPVAADGKLYVATLPGTLYIFDQKTGEVNSARSVRATSAPVVYKSNLLYTARVDEQEQEITEGIIAERLDKSARLYAAARSKAPYLDRVVQEASEATSAAGAFESSNGIGGGFGGGFGGNQCGDPLNDSKDQGSECQVGGITQAEDEHPSDPLAVQQERAADNIGLGNVSTIQAYHGSRLLHWGGRHYNCMGDRILCTSPQTGEIIWQFKLQGDLKVIGGHLATPPIRAGNDLLVVTHDGAVLRFHPESGRITDELKLDTAVRFPPLYASGRIYVSTQDGRIICRKLTDDDSGADDWPQLGLTAAHNQVVPEVPR